MWNGHEYNTVCYTEIILDYFVVNTAETEAIPANSYELLQVREITDKNNNSIIQLYDEAQKSITFPQSGIYTITFYVRDTRQKETVAKIEIPVNPE